MSVEIFLEPDTRESKFLEFIYQCCIRSRGLNWMMDLRSGMVALAAISRQSSAVTPELTGRVSGNHDFGHVLSAVDAHGLPRCPASSDKNTLNDKSGSSGSETRLNDRTSVQSGLRSDNCVPVPEHEEGVVTDATDKAPVSVIHATDDQNTTHESSENSVAQEVFLKPENPGNQSDFLKRISPLTDLSSTHEPSTPGDDAYVVPETGAGVVGATGHIVDGDETYPETDPEILQDTGTPDTIGGPVTTVLANSASRKTDARNPSGQAESETENKTLSDTSQNDTNSLMFFLSPALPIAAISTIPQRNESAEKSFSVSLASMGSAAERDVASLPKSQQDDQRKMISPVMAPMTDLVDSTVVSFDVHEIQHDNSPNDSRGAGQGVDADASVETVGMDSGSINAPPSFNINPVISPDTAAWLNGGSTQSVHVADAGSMQTYDRVASVDVPVSPTLRLHSIDSGTTHLDVMMPHIDASPMHIRIEVNDSGDANVRIQSADPSLIQDMRAGQEQLLSMINQGDAAGHDRPVTLEISSTLQPDMTGLTSDNGFSGGQSEARQHRSNMGEGIASAGCSKGVFSPISVLSGQQAGRIVTISGLNITA